MRTIKVVDFGLSSKYCQTQGGLDQHCGTVVYMAPEIVVHKHEYTKSVDIWATGIIMHEVLTGGRHPLYVPKEDNVESYRNKLMKIEEFKVPAEFSKIARTLFLKLTKF